MTIRFIGEGAVLGSVVKTGNAQIGFTIPAQYVDDYKNDKTLQFISKDQSGTGLQMVMNVRKPPLDNISVRRALHHASDQAAINKLLYDGYYAPSEGPLEQQPSLLLGWRRQDVRALGRQGARRCSTQAGWKAVAGKPIREAQGVAGVADGTPLRIRYNVLHHKEIGEALQAQMRRAGIDLAVEVVPGPVQLDRVRKRDFDLMYERQRSPDPLILDQVWNSKWDQPGGWAWTGFKDDTLDATLNKLRALPSIDERCEAAKQAQKIIMENALMLPTLSDPVFVAMSRQGEGLQDGRGRQLVLPEQRLDRQVTSARPDRGPDPRSGRLSAVLLRR